MLLYFTCLGVNVRKRRLAIQALFEIAQKTALIKMSSSHAELREQELTRGGPESAVKSCHFFHYLIKQPGRLIPKDSFCNLFGCRYKVSSDYTFHRHRTSITGRRAMLRVSMFICPRSLRLRNQRFAIPAPIDLDENAISFGKDAQMPSFLRRTALAKPKCAGIWDQVVDDVILFNGIGVTHTTSISTVYSKVRSI